MTTKRAQDMASAIEVPAAIGITFGGLLFGLGLRAQINPSFSGEPLVPRQMILC